MMVDPVGDGIAFFREGLQGYVVAGALVMTRLSGTMIFVPVFSSVGIPPRVKAALVLALTLVLAPPLSRTATMPTEVTVGAIFGELGVGLALGLSLGLLTEMLNFTAALLSMEFSFSLVNLMDPNTQVETPVLGQLLGWVGVLVLLGAGLHRTVIAAMAATFAVVPPGHAVLQATSALALTHMASGVFLAGVQLASPVIAAALAVELAIAFMARLAPQLPSTVLSVPVKTMASYVVLIGSLGLWPRLIEHRFTQLLTGAAAMLRAG